MTAAVLLDRLDGVRQVGPDRWIARCPAHDDARASLSIRELADGRTLLHDFAGCGVGNILAAAGLDFDELFPERATDHRVRRERAPFPATDVLRAIIGEAWIAAIVLGHTLNGAPLSEEASERGLLAVRRLLDAAERDRAGANA